MRISFGAYKCEGEGQKALEVGDGGIVLGIDEVPEVDGKKDAPGPAPIPKGF